MSKRLYRSMFLSVRLSVVCSRYLASNWYRTYGFLSFFFSFSYTLLLTFLKQKKCVKPSRQSRQSRRLVKWKTCIPVETRTSRHESKTYDIDYVNRFLIIHSPFNLRVNDVLYGRGKRYLRCMTRSVWLILTLTLIC